MSVKKTKPRGLGRGLDAVYGDLLGDGSAAASSAQGRIDETDIQSLHPGKYQPRTRMDEASLEALAQSIRTEGVISPIIVRPIGGAQYEIIAGERRFRAAKLAGLERVPVIIREVDDSHALQMGLIENIQREDLNVMEEAAGVARLIEEFHFTHEQAADAIGRSRSATTNLLRLLTLTAEVQAMVMDGELEMGHARALLALSAADQVLAAKTVAAKSLSVRQTEELVKTFLRQGDAPQKKRVVIKTRDDERLEESLAETLGAVVKLSANRKGKGKIVIEFADLDQLQGIVDRIQRTNQ